MPKNYSWPLAALSLFCLFCCPILAEEMTHFATPEGGKIFGMYNQGQDQYDKKNFKEYFKINQNILNAKVSETTLGEIMWYRAAAAYAVACGYALFKEPDKSLKALEDAVELGWEDSELTKKDADFTALRKDKRFIACLEKMEQNAKAKVTLAGSLTVLPHLSRAALVVRDKAGNPCRVLVLTLNQKQAKQANKFIKTKEPVTVIGTGGGSLHHFTIKVESLEPEKKK